jgi:hypothetical protein
MDSKSTTFHYYSGGKSSNGIHDPETKVTFPQYQSNLSIFRSELLLNLNTCCDKIWLTSDEILEPQFRRHCQAEESFNHDQGRKVMALRVLDDRVPISPDDLDGNGA